jgi:hypothetical protein
MMLTLQSKVTVPGVTGLEITDFMLDCADDRYQAWWPGTHLQFHVLARGSRGEHIGDVVLMDEYVGSRRVRMVGEVVEAVPGEKIVWQLRLGRLRAPVRLSLVSNATEEGVALCHTITAGWSGVGRWLDPLWRLYFSKSFARAMDRHAHTEFPMLSNLLQPQAAGHLKPAR